MKKKLIRILSALMAIILLGAAFVAAVNIRMCAETRDSIVSTETAGELGAEYIIVLGAGVRNGAPTPMLADRLSCGEDLYFSGAAPKLIMSGDRLDAEKYDEVSVMTACTVEAGVPEADVLEDPLGLSTYESIIRAKEEFGAESIVIVTQRYHLYRALYIAEKCGVEAVGVPADTRQYMGQFVRDIREYLARVKDWIMCL